VAIKTLILKAYIFQERTISTKVNELVQLNQWGPYSYSRDQLVELLDKALAGDASSE